MSSKAFILQSPQASKSPLSVATSKADFAAPLALFASPLPITPMIASGTYFSTTELGCSVLPSESQDRQFVARMLGQEFGNIQDTSIQDHPQFTFLVVLRHLFHGVTSFGGIISFIACAMESFCQSLAERFCAGTSLQWQRQHTPAEAV